MKKIKRKKTKVVQIGDKKIGGDFPILVQSMTNTLTSDVEKTVKQIKRLERAGCEIIRIGVPDLKAAKAIKEIKKRINIPLVADIHFSAALAKEAILQGVDKIRINPGNFPKSELKEVVNLAKEKNIPIRVGVNAGSLEKDLLEKYGHSSAKALAESALRNTKLLENFGFYNIVISAKASDVLRTIEVYEILSKETDYPLHLGVTEAGGKLIGAIKSSIALGYLLKEGIGDTIRISLSSDPVEEVKVAFEILKNLELRKEGVQIVSCPTCSRTKIDVISISKEIENFTKNIKQPLKIAILGCVVNGLGEGREADLAVVGVGKNLALFMRNGKIIKKIKANKIIDLLKEEINNLIKKS
ncbi:MAG: flavodoxin-dependent (E)-4-hydroxy-3-methylbut-2-enyl-diphosphate synthase [Minisyncoccia bacterium]